MFNKTPVETHVEATFKAAVLRANNAVELLEKIKSTLVQAESSLPLVEQQLASALKELEHVESQALLDGDTPAAKTARQSVSRAREAHDAASAAVRGLRARLAEVETTLLGLKAELAIAKGPWSDAVLAEYRKEYLAAAEQFAVIVRKGLVIGRVIDRRLSGLEEMRLVEPDSSNNTILELQPSAFENELGSTWRSEAIPLSQLHSEVRTVEEKLRGALGRSNELDTLAIDIENRRRREGSDSGRVRSEQSLELAGQRK